MTITLDRTYQTRDGRPVKIFMVDGGGDFPVIGTYFSNGWWRCCSWTCDGESVYSIDDTIDIIEVKPRIQRTVWVNVYRDCCDMFHSKENADISVSRYASNPRLACIEVKIDCQEGEGL